MPITHTNEDGTTVEAFTKEELESKAKEVAEQIVAAKESEYTTKITTLEKSLSDKEVELTTALNAGGNEEQIKRLRQERDDAKKGLDDVAKQYSDKFAGVEKFVQESYREELVSKYNPAKDAQTREKILLEFENYLPNDTTRDGIARRMEVAAKIVGASQAQPDINPFAVGGGNANHKPSNGISDSTRQMGKEMFGLKNEDYEKFSNK